MGKKDRIEIKNLLELLQRLSLKSRLRSLLSWLKLKGPRKLIVYGLAGIIAIKILVLIFNFGLRFSRQDIAPEAIVVLGGSYYVERFAAEIAAQNPSIPVIISSGSTPPCAYKYFVVDAGNDWKRIIIDFRANDTMTNFTASLPYLAEMGVRRVIVVATNGHWKRAKNIGFFVFGSNGIAIQPRLLDGQGHYETPTKRVLDAIRAFAWMIFGETVVNSSYVLPEKVLEKKAIFEADCQDATHNRLPEPGQPVSSFTLSKEGQLFRAINLVDIELVKTLLAGGINPNAVNKKGTSALALAVKMDVADITEALYRRGADFGHVNGDGKRVLDLIVENGRVSKKLGEELRALGYLGSTGKSPREDNKKEPKKPGQFHLSEKISIKRFPSGNVSELLVVIENSHDKDAYAVKLNAVFGFGVLERLNGPTTIAARGQAHYTLQLSNDASLYSKITEFRGTCESCESSDISIPVD